MLTWLYRLKQEGGNCLWYKQYTKFIKMCEIREIYKIFLKAVILIIARQTQNINSFKIRGKGTYEIKNHTNALNLKKVWFICRL